MNSGDNPDPGSENTDLRNETLPNEDLPRFLIAAKSYEEFLQAQASVADGNSEERAQYFSDLMGRCNNLVGFSQTYDFIKSIPNLAGTQAEDSCAQRLADELARVDIPEEVKGIYWDLYGQDLQQFAEPQST